MKMYILILPISLLVTYSQIVMKWRAGDSSQKALDRIADYYFSLFSDPWVVSAYAAAFLSSFAWLLVVSKLPLITAFPVYIGLTFALVLLSGNLLLSEALTVQKVISIALILVGIVVGVRA